MTKLSRRGCLLLVPPAVLGALGVGFLWPEGSRRTGQYLRWNNDEVPPVVRLTVPATTVRGQTTIGVQIDDENLWDVLSMEIDGEPLRYSGTQLVLDTTGLPDGQHVVTVKVGDRSRRVNVATAQAVFSTRNSGPILDLLPRSNRVGQGQTLLVLVTTDEPATIEGKFDTIQLKFINEGQRAWALAGLDNLARAGNRKLTLNAVDELGNTTQAAFDIAVFPVNYPVEEVWLPPGGSDEIASDVNAREIARLDAIFAEVTPLKRWDSLFMKPVNAEVSSDFATGRSYNGGPVTGRHWGTDFAANLATPVAAAMHGKVVLTDRLVVRGNAIILDHGLGVFTCYYHLSRPDVKLGQEVKKGDIIGLSGATGDVTGPHLHWEMRVRGLAVDPIAWTVETFP